MAEAAEKRAKLGPAITFVTGNKKKLEEVVHNPRLLYQSCALPI
jgi:hypothetical protein